MRKSNINTSTAIPYHKIYIWDYNVFDTENTLITNEHSVLNIFKNTILTLKYQMHRLTKLFVDHKILTLKYQMHRLTKIFVDHKILAFTHVGVGEKQIVSLG